MKYRTITAAALLALAARGADAQSPRRLSLRVDNDAFNFWMLPWNRPDEEYTSGVHIALEGGAAPWWARMFGAEGEPCAARATGCLTDRIELGQDIYTPATSRDEPRAGDGARPNGGWLYLGQTLRSLGSTRSDELTIAVGVTGPPSLARFTQRVAHSLAPDFNRPTDWSRQIAFEPGVIARFEQRRRVASGTAGGFAADLIPWWALAAGNISTLAEAGLQSRLGWHLDHPWLPRSRRSEVTLVAGFSGRAIARDIFLDGNTFDASLRVGHRPFVASGEAGFEVHLGPVDLGYRAVTSSRSYDGGRAWHPWSSLVGGFTFLR